MNENTTVLVSVTGRSEVLKMPWSRAFVRFMRHTPYFHEREKCEQVLQAFGGFKTTAGGVTLFISLPREMTL